MANARRGDWVSRGLAVGPALLILAAVGWLAARDARACSRAVYLGADGVVVVGRSMDWMEDLRTNLYVLPRGVRREGAAGKNSLTWTSKYGSVVATGLEIATVDGMNEKGLVGNLLYLAEADFGPRDESRPGLSAFAWTQYVLDRYATVAEAVGDLRRERFQVVMTEFGDKVRAKPTVHLSISDPTGDSAIFEFIGGKLVIHHGRQFQVMTNSPTYDRQLALDGYWDELKGHDFLPGTSRAADRFVRASYYVKGLRQAKTDREAVAGVLSVLRNVSVPWVAESDPDSPNIAPTLWRTAADQTRRVYYFESTTSPNVVWVELDRLDFSEGSAVKKLTLTGDPDHEGEVSGEFFPSPPFRFLAPASP